MSFVAESILSAIINVLVKKFSSIDFKQLQRGEHIQSDLEKWEKTLLKIEAVVDDAEEKQMTNKLLEIWLGELKNLAFDIEDIFDVFATETLRRKLVDEPQASTSKVRKFLPICVAGLNPLSYKLNSTMVSQIKEINHRLQKIVEEKEAFDLNVSSRANTHQGCHRRPVTTSLNEPQIYGRDEDKEAIVELLLKKHAADTNFSVISIQGMGGLGKTTLAQLVYNDARVKAYFDVSVWTCVSDDFNVQHLTKTILECVADKACDINDLNMLQVKLKEQLFGKKFIIIFDDVWDANYENWTKLCLPFQVASFGSKIIVTTRNYGVSCMVGALPPYLLKGLPDDDCLSIFTFHSLVKNFNEHQDLKEIGEKIAQRCKGLPLAAKALGGLLRGKTNSKDWNEVLKSNMWSSSEDKSGIIPALRVSYFYLPSHLKRCFAYCSIFPKDYEFHKEELILLWMAEGFLQTYSDKLIEDLGEEYFADLQFRSFFQKSSNYASTFFMHDLINDLAQWAAKDFCLRIGNLQESKRQWEVPANLRYLSFLNYGSNHACIQNFFTLSEIKRLRTFVSLPLPSLFWIKEEGICDFPSALLQLRYLKVLSLNGYPISVLPEEIGDLKLLHHIDLSHTLIRFLPASINRLCKLEALLLKGCSRLERLLSDMGNLIKLRLLCITNAYHFQLEKIPLRIGQSTFPTEHWFEKVQASGAGFQNLQLEWTCSFEDSNKKLHHNIKSLQIDGYGRIRFPRTLEATSFWSLVSLKVEHCVSLPSLGQLPSLKKLLILDVRELKSLGPEFYGLGSSIPFKSLEQFEISSIHELTEWVPCNCGRNVEAFPRLRQLSIKRCHKFQGKLPGYFPSLESLLIENCEQLVVFIPMLPKYCNIQIHRCKEVVLQSIKHYSSMIHLLSGISNEVLLLEGVADKSSKVGKIDIVWYMEPGSFSRREVQSVRELKRSTVDFYTVLTLREDEEEEIQKQELPGRCQYLVLTGCKSSVKLEQALESLTFLTILSIRDSHNISFLPEVPLPSHLRSLIIHDCSAIHSLPKAWMQRSNTYLETLIIEHSSLTSISKGQLPPTLNRVVLLCCAYLVSMLNEEEVVDSLGDINLLNHAPAVSSGSQHKDLKYLHVSCCRKLVSLANSFHSYINLEELLLSDCDKLRTLPAGMNNLTSLHTLIIKFCPLASIPEGGFPTSLTSLIIRDTKLCRSLFEWGLHKLTSLKLLRIDGCNHVITFPQEDIGMVLPSSLVALRIENFRNLERLSSFTQNLDCLKYLSFIDCRKLKFLPPDGLPVSVENFRIMDRSLSDESCLMSELDYYPEIPRISEIATNEFNRYF